MNKHLRGWIAFVLSFAALIVGILGKAGLKLTPLPGDLEWITAFVVALLVPLWSIQLELKYETNDIVKKVGDKIDAAVALGKVILIRSNNEAALSVSDALKSSTDVWNTYIVSGGEPYNPQAARKIENAIGEFIKRDDTTFREIYSHRGKSRINRLKERLGGKIPENYTPRVVKSSLGDFPACNFIILERSKPPIKQEIYFGWGYFKWSESDKVFWSNDQELIAFFKAYYNSLDYISEDYT